MTAPTDQIVDIAKRSQETVTTAVRTWADTIQSLTGSLNGGQSKLPDVHAFVDNYFDFAEQVLANQRRFARTLLSAGAQAAEAVTEQATRATESVAAHTANATEAASDKAAEATQAAGEQSAANARAAKGASKN